MTASTTTGKKSPFDDLLAPLSSGEILLVPSGWGQGRAVFGGLVAAMLYRRACAVVESASPAPSTASPPAAQPPRSLAFSLVAPLAPGEARVEARVLRAGKSVTQAEARIVQGGQVAAVMLASFGAARASEVRVAPAPPPAFPAPASLPAFRYVPGLTPEFTQHFDLRLATGGFPYSNADEAEIGGWIRFRESPPVLDVEHLLGLVDAWPPAILPTLARPTPASTLAWTIELTEAPTVAPGDADGASFLGYIAHTEVAASGYAHIASRLFRRDGTLLAIGRQTVAVFG